MLIAQRLFALAAQWIEDSQDDQAKLCNHFPLFFFYLLGMESHTIFLRWPLASYNIARDDTRGYVFQLSFKLVHDCISDVI